VVATAISVPVGRGAGGGFEDLVEFRECLYGCLTKRGDAMFGVVDALCGPVVVESLAHLSLVDGHERRFYPVRPVTAYRILIGLRQAAQTSGQLAALQCPAGFWDSHRRRRRAGPSGG
jgi:hypothetical protein